MLRYFEISGFGLKPTRFSNLRFKNYFQWKVRAKNGPKISKWVPKLLDIFLQGRLLRREIHKEKDLCDGKNDSLRHLPYRDMLSTTTFFLGEGIGSNLRAPELAAAFTDPALQLDRLEALMREFVHAAEAGTHAELVELFPDLL